MKYLNIGCGDRWHPQWTNIDTKSRGEGIIAYDIKNGIPFQNNSFDVVYHSHLLEHLPKSEAEPFLKECCRVLRPQGILRVVFPDLEQIARLYLKALEIAISGSQEWAANYEWILLEMYDQVVRNYPGGEMADYLKQEKIPNKDFILQRCGTFAKKPMESSYQDRQVQAEASFRDRVKSFLKPIYRFIRYSKIRRDFILKILLNEEEYSALKIGYFRQSGEVHQWMYDRYSLSKLLANCGLEKIARCSATESYIPNWNTYNLDTEPDGVVYKPDSLYMEAIKPTAYESSTN
jgi:predicted SAM-dependent methyltransferase